MTKWSNSTSGKKIAQKLGWGGGGDEGVAQLSRMASTVKIKFPKLFILGS